MRRVLLALALVALVATPALAGSRDQECEFIQIRYHKLVLTKAGWSADHKFYVESDWIKYPEDGVVPGLVNGGKYTLDVPFDIGGETYMYSAFDKRLYENPKCTTTTTEGTTTTSTTIVEETTTTVDDTTTTSVEEETTTTPVVDSESSTTIVDETTTTIGTTTTTDPGDPPDELPRTGVEDWLGQAGGALLLMGVAVLGLARRKFLSE